MGKKGERKRREREEEMKDLRKKIQGVIQAIVEIVDHRKGDTELPTLPHPATEVTSIFDVEDAQDKLKIMKWIILGGGIDDRIKTLSLMFQSQVREQHLKDSLAAWAGEVLGGVKLDNYESLRGAMVEMGVFGFGNGLVEELEVKLARKLRKREHEKAATEELKKNRNDVKYLRKTWEMVKKSLREERRKERVGEEERGGGGGEGGEGGGGGGRGQLLWVLEVIVLSSSEEEEEGVDGEERRRRREERKKKEREEKKREEEEKKKKEEEEKKRKEEMMLRSIGGVD